jgi:translation initiation factor 2 alpha subunit (eIF-2alpha)
MTARAFGTTDTPISVTVKASPVYVLSATHLDKGVAVDMLNKAIEAIKTKIAEYPSGALEIKTAPKSVTV